MFAPKALPSCMPCSMKHVLCMDVSKHTYTFVNGITHVYLNTYRLQAEAVIWGPPVLFRETSGGSKTEAVTGAAQSWVCHASGRSKKPVLEQSCCFYVGGKLNCPGAVVLLLCWRETKLSRSNRFAFVFGRRKLSWVYRAFWSSRVALMSGKN